MVYRKDDWWWDWTWTPVSGCTPVSEGCQQCWTLPWLQSHTWRKPTVYYGAITVAMDASLRWNGNLTALRPGDPVWTLPFSHHGVANPALGPGQPNLIFAVVDGDLFIDGRPKEHIDRVCMTLVGSDHIGLLCSKYTREMADYFVALDPRRVQRWQQKLWLGFSAENQERFDQRWADMCPRAEEGWFVYVALSPLLEPVTLPEDFLALGRWTWVVVYGECNRWEPERARPMDPNWVRAILKQCREAGIPFFLRGMHTGADTPPDLINLREFPDWP